MKESENSWIDLKQKLPEPYKYVLVKAKGDAEWKSFMFPNKEWMKGDKPTHWRPFIDKENIKP